MLARLKRTATAFLAVLTAFWAYRLAAVPFIDPPLRETRVRNSDPVDAAPLAQQNRLEPYWRFFPAGSWERDNPIVLESDTMKAIVKNYQVGDGKRLARNCLEFKPCTLIFLPDGEAEGPDSRRRVIVMRTQDDQSAVLQFENEVDLTRPQLGKLIGGQINGPVIIWSAATKPAGGDDLEVHARDLKMLNNEITSDYPVQFRFGPSYGSGSDMHITLLPAQSGGGSIAAGIGGIQEFKLNRDVQMHLQPGEAGFIPGDERAPQKNADENRPVDIRCTGPFAFDLVAYIAEFHDDVVMLRPNPPGRDDRLTAALFTIFFAERELTPAEKAAKTAAAKNDQAAEQTAGGPKIPQLVPQKFKAQGAPVVLDAPSRQVYAVGDEMEYDHSTGRISLKAAPGAKPAYLKVQEVNEAEASSLHYQRAPQGHLIGQLYSDGPGWLRARPNENSDDEIVARWGKKLVLRPEQNEHLLWIVGEAHVNYTDTGLIDSDEICLWINELPAEAVSPAANGQAGSLPSGRGTTADQIRARVRPDRLLATGRVHFESRQLDGDMDELKAWFRTVAANPNLLANRAPRDPDRRRSTSEPRQRTVERDQDHYKVVCRTIEAGIDLNGSRSDVQWAKLIDNVAFDQTPATIGDEPPLSIRGDWLGLSDANTPREHLTVAGKPASILAQGLTMRGATVELDRGSKRLWIEGPGDMHLPARPQPTGQIRPAAMTGQPHDPLAMSNRGPLTVEWRAGMDFDGRTVSFKKGVVAKQVTPEAEQSIRNELLKVTLRGQIDFSNTRQRGQQPEVEFVAAPGNALLESRSYKNGQPLAVEFMNVTDLAVNQITGETRSIGPGLVKSWRYGPRQELTMPGSPASRSPAAPPASAATPQPEEFQITYSQIEFQNGIAGSVLENQRSITFNDRVRGIFGAVPDWQTELVDESSQPGKMVLHCDQIIASQPPRAPGAAASTNVVTVGNTHLEGTGERGELFSAYGHSLKYDQAKDQVLLEWDGRTLAQASRQERIGAPPQQVAGRTLVGSRKTGTFRGELQHVDGSMLTPQPPPRGNPPPPQQRPR